MSISKLLTSVAVAAFTVTALHGERRCPGNVPSVPLRQVSGALIVVSLTVNGAGPFDFLVDTGAQITTVDDQLASQLNLPADGTTGVSGVATYGRKPVSQIGRIEVAGQQSDDVLTIIDNLAQLQAADRNIRGILGENFLAHFDLLIDNERRMLCLDETGAMAAAIKGTRLPLAQPYGADHDLPFTRPLVIEARLDGIKDPVLFRLDSGSNVPLIYGGGGQPLQLVRANVQTLKRIVDGVEQDFAVLQPKDVSFSSFKVHQMIFVQPMKKIGAVRQTREDGLLPTQGFRRVFVSYRNQFAILDPK